MTQQVTNGIKISVTTNFEGTRYQNYRLHYVFNYEVTIENQTNATVQLLSRHWNIFDSLSNFTIVKGNGVIGKNPILAPKEKHIYNSFCSLKSSIGSMNGFYNMIIINTSQKFKVTIPTFQLIVPEFFN